MSLKSIKQQLTRNRGKTTVLGALSLVLVVMGLKAFQSLQPQHASAITPPRTVSAADAPHAAPDADLDKRARESLALWSLLREKRGLEADVAYHFDPSYFNLDPSKQREHDAVVDHIITPVPEKSTQNPTDQDLGKSREAHVRELARNLVVQTTILGPDPKALITVSGSSHVVRLGEMIDGFKVVGIDGREVRIQREGITLGLKMGPE